MKVSSLNYINPSFKSAHVSINVVSDTHGELLLANSALEEMKKRNRDIFCRNEKGNANVFAVCGDWFMDGGKKGYVSNPQKPLAMFQLEILNEFFNQVKTIADNTTMLFTPGNHEFDGGVPLLDEILSGINAEVIASNLDIEHSQGFSKSIRGNKIFNEKTVEVEDDKNPDLKHKILFLGVMPVNLRMYQKNLQGISLIDLNDKPSAFVDKEDYKETLKFCKERIAEFKKKNPTGIVIFMSHTGAEFSDNLAKESQVDIAFDAHEHKTKTRIVNKTPIIPLSQNFLRVANAKINIDDDGKIDVISLMNFNPSKNTKKGPLFRLYNELLSEDIKKKYTIKSDNPEIGVLDVKGIREGNSFLANFVTDSVLSELKKIDPSIDIFALNSSAIRHPLQISNEPSISSFDVLNVLAGIKEDDGKIMTTEITGAQLVFWVIDNLMFNKIKPQRNPIIHYSGLIIDKQEILKAAEAGRSLDEIAKYIISADTNLPVETDKTYKIANVEKYFNKSQTTEIKEQKKHSEYLGCSVQELFRRHFDTQRDNLYAKCDVRIK